LLACLILTAPLLLFACAWSARLPRRIYLGCIALTTVAAFPVQHLLLIGSDLSGARILYMLSLGWAILWGAVFSAIPSSRLRTLAIVWILTWHAVMLHHNLAFWLQVPQQAREVCAEFGRTLAKIQTQAVVSGLPQKKNGVTFLANGFPQCVAMNSDVPASRVSVNGEPNFEWNETTERIEAISERK
jgi:hypothetical protein